MRKQIEFGCGNTWLLRTEFEASDGMDVGEGKDLDFIHDKALTIGAIESYILDVKEGFKRQRKMSNAVKFVVGIASEVI